MRLPSNVALLEMSHCLHGHFVCVTYFKQGNILQYIALNWSTDTTFARPNR